MLRMSLVILLGLLVTSCASVPRWGAVDCNKPNVDVVTTADDVFICKDSPEVVRLPSYQQLLQLPPAEIMPVVAVYSFLDKTGQRKSVDNIASFSTAVTQGGTEMLIDALKTAGGGTWFRVVERSGIDHLIRERQIVRTTRQEYAEPDEEKTTYIAPLLFAGIIVEGAVIGYDTNIETGGRGARTLGIGLSNQYRKDVVTVSLRAVSVQTGEVLLNVQARKTVLSYGGGFDVFRFVDMDTQLVEIEDGVGNNESVTYAVRAAIEAAVLELVFQGEERALWKINRPAEVQEEEEIILRKEIEEESVEQPEE